jgi:ABC-type lipoprotein release transport system permease subunit
MAIIERFHEIGVMKSIGTRPGKIFFMIIFEAMNLGAVGLSVGLSLSLLLIVFFNSYGIDLSAFTATMRKWGMGSVIYPIIRFQDIAVSFAIVFITTMLSSLYPAIKAARIKPLKALNYL